MLHRTIVWFLGAGLMAGAVFAAEPKGLPGENPNPIHLIRHPVAAALRDGEAWPGHIFRHEPVIVGQDGLRVLSQP